jgi:hypothetical protein
VELNLRTVTTAGAAWTFVAANIAMTAAHPALGAVDPPGLSIAAAGLLTAWLYVRGLSRENAALRADVTRLSNVVEFVALSRGAPAEQAVDPDGLATVTAIRPIRGERCIGIAPPGVEPDVDVDAIFDSLIEGEDVS